MLSKSRSDQPAQFPDKRMRRGAEITIGYLNRKERKQLAKRSPLSCSSTASPDGPFIISIFEASLSKGASRSPPPQQSFIEISAVAAALLLLSTKEKGRSGRSNGRTDGSRSRTDQVLHCRRCSVMSRWSAGDGRIPLNEDAWISNEVTAGMGRSRSL